MQLTAMTFKLEISTGNAAFETETSPGVYEDNLDEIGICLQHVSQKLAAGQTSGSIIDTNGNTVGTYWIEDDDA